MANTSSVPPNININGIRSTIPSGYVLGRSTRGHGRVQLIPLNGFAGGGGAGAGGGVAPTPTPPGAVFANYLAAIWVLGA